MAGIKACNLGSRDPTRGPMSVELVIDREGTLGRL